mmetsp:Transcript_63700/g.138007  ORF Transcript_63700/g.138007 Transcript_63700/m.138007 type:complete len:202 (-) Transcript_63700:225-830(-)
MWSSTSILASRPARVVASPPQPDLRRSSRRLACRSCRTRGRHRGCTRSRRWTRRSAQSRKGAFIQPIMKAPSVPMAPCRVFLVSTSTQPPSGSPRPCDLMASVGWISMSHARPSESITRSAKKWKPMDPHACACAFLRHESLPRAARMKVAMETSMAFQTFSGSRPFCSFKILNHLCRDPPEPASCSGPSGWPQLGAFGHW